MTDRYFLHIRERFMDGAAPGITPADVLTHNWKTNKKENRSAILRNRIRSTEKSRLFIPCAAKSELGKIRADGDFQLITRYEKQLIWSMVDLWGRAISQHASIQQCEAPNVIPILT